MRYFQIIAFMLLGYSAATGTRIILTLQHPNILLRFTARGFPADKKFDTITGMMRKVCSAVIAGDIFKTVNGEESSVTTPAHFPAQALPLIVRNPRVRTLLFEHNGGEVLIEVIECVTYNGKILYVENAIDETDFYVFEKTVNSNNAPLIRWATKAPLIQWDIRSVVEQAEQEGVHSLGERAYATLFYNEKDFQANYISIGPRRWKHICSITGFERFELCSRLHPVWGTLYNMSRNMVNRMWVGGGTCGPATARLHIPSNDPVGRGGFLPVEVIGCYINREMNVNTRPTFYIAADNRTDGGAYMLNNSPLQHMRYLLVIMRLSDIPTLVDLA